MTRAYPAKLPVHGQEFANDVEGHERLIEDGRAAFDTRALSPSTLLRPVSIQTNDSC